MSLRADFLRFDDRLARLGVRPLTDWWRAGIGSWLDAYEQGNVLELFACVGRGAAKSIALYKLALFFTLFGDWTIPTGERHYAIVLSRLKDEASKGLDIITNWLTLLRVEHRCAGDVIEIASMPRGIRVVAASVAATSGWRAYFVGKDERSKWPSSDEDETDAGEIDTSAAAMTATHARAPIVAVGSAWATFGAFYEAISAGSTTTRTVLGPTPTWIAAPHISEESTRRKEPDQRKWEREYASRAQSAKLAAFDAAAVKAAFEARQLTGMCFPSFGVVDASSGKKDTWAWSVARWQAATPALDAPRQLAFTHVDGIEGRFWAQDAGEKVVAKVAADMRKHGVTRVYGDQRESLMLASAFTRHGIRFVELPWVAARKERAVMVVRRWLADKVLVLPMHAKLRDELLAFEERITPSGGLTFAGGRGTNGKDDYVALLLTAAMADSEPPSKETPSLPGSPSRGLTMADALRVAGTRDRSGREAVQRLGLDSHDHHAAFRRLLGGR